jgi:hypothetical protein
MTGLLHATTSILSAADAGQCRVARQKASASTPTCSPVTLKGKTGADGYVPENDAWFDQLTKPDDETGRVDSKGRPRRIGRDPLSIPPEVLTAAGHPPRRTSSVVATLRKALDLDLEDLREYRDLRRYCLECAENSAEVKRCSIIDCPFWPYRMGKNPHNPKRGKNPFNARAAS